MERQYQILIVDDDDAILSSYQDYFTKQGFTVKVAHNGIEGLEKLREIDFDVALVDINMPNMNGLEMIKPANEENIWHLAQFCDSLAGSPTTAIH